MWRACPKDEEKAMWRIFQGNRAARDISEITRSTANVDVRALIGWLPSRTWVVLYATDHIPKGLNHLPLLRSDLKFYAWSGGLRAWWRDDLELETVEPYAGGLRARQ
jgi:hypothetical protein